MVKLSIEQERVSTLIADTVTLLCKNGLQFKSEMKVTGLLGISLDNEVFLVQIEKCFGEEITVKVADNDNCVNKSLSGDESDRSYEKTQKRHRKKRRKVDLESDNQEMKVKEEPAFDEDSDLIVIETAIKDEVNDNNYGQYFDSSAMSANPSTSSQQNAQYQNNSQACRWNNNSQDLSGGADDSNSVLSSGELMSHVATTSGKDAADWLNNVAPTWLGNDSKSNIHRNLAFKGCVADSNTLWDNSLVQNMDEQQWWTDDSGRMADSLLNDTSNIRRRGLAKPMRCGYPGCDKVYANHQNVLRHQKRDHGRKQFEKGLFKFAAAVNDMNSGQSDCEMSERT